MPLKKKKLPIFAIGTSASELTRDIILFEGHTVPTLENRQVWLSNHCHKVNTMTNKIKGPILTI